MPSRSAVVRTRRLSVDLRQNSFTMNYYYGNADETWWFHWSGDIGREGWNAYVQRCHQMLDQRAQAFLCTSYRAVAPCRQSLQDIALLLRSRKHDFRRLRHVAFVADPQLLRAAQVLDWMTVKPFEERGFLSPRLAAEWLDSLAMSGSLALAEAQRVVSPEHWWPNEES